MGGFDGHLHEKDAKRVLRVVLPLSILIAIGTIVWRDAWQVGLGLYLGALCGYVITPDADHRAMTREEYRAMKKWGVFGAVLVGYMMPYAYLFPHRSRWSHSIFPGTVLRILYVTWWLIGLILLLRFQLDLKVLWIPFYSSFIFGWSLQDAFHYRRDNLGFLGMVRRRVRYV